MVHEISAATSDFAGAQWNTVENYLVVTVLAFLVAAIVYFWKEEL